MSNDDYEIPEHDVYYDENGVARSKSKDNKEFCEYCGWAWWTKKDHSKCKTVRNKYK